MSVCEICGGVGWVCELHLNSPADLNGPCCSIPDCNGAICNCLCNPNGEYEFETVFASTEPDKVKKWVQ